MSNQQAVAVILMIWPAEGRKVQTDTKRTLVLLNNVTYEDMQLLKSVQRRGQNQQVWIQVL